MSATDESPEPKSDIRKQIQFLESIEAVADERAAAYATRDIDPDRWKRAKQSYAEARSFYRLADGRLEHGAATISNVTEGS